MTPTPSISAHMSLGQWAMLLVIALFWGGAFFFVSVAVREMPPMTLGAVRILVGGFVLLAILHMTGGRLPWRADVWRWFFIVALVNSVAPLFLLSWAQKSIGGGLASIITAMTPLMVLFVAHFMTTDEKLSGRRLLGTLIGFGGVVVMIGLDAKVQIGLSTAAQLAAVLASLCFAFGTVLARRFRALEIPPLTASTGFILMSGLQFLVLALLIDSPWTLPRPGPAALSSAIAAGFLSTALGQFLFFRLLTHTGANNVSLVAVLTPISAILLGWLILGEQLRSYQIAGMAIIAAGIIIVDGRLFSSRKVKQSGEAA
jgi:drug/metabolite transporter (DMT)-like permease